jgi:hypothetical protein
MTKVTGAAGMRRDHRGSHSDSRELAPRRERERAGERRPGPAADAGRGPDAASGADGGPGADAASGPDAVRPDGAQGAARMGDTISMMLDRLRDAAAAHDEDCAPDGG